MSKLNSETFNTIYEALMKDPVKRSMIVKLVNENKDALEEYEKKNKKTNNKWKSPLKCQKKTEDYESPIAYFKRKMILNQQTGNVENFDKLDCDQLAKRKPFEKVLDGIKIYVEIMDGSNNRSHAVKLLAQDMGANIHESFTSDVTHVMFLGGSYNTYRRATLLKVHLVSVLWIDACKTHSAKMPEKNYPAINFMVSDNETNRVLQGIENIYCEDSPTSNYNTKEGHSKNSCQDSFSSSQSTSVLQYATPTCNRKSVAPNLNTTKSRSPFVTDFVTVRKKLTKTRNSTRKTRQTMFELASDYCSNSDKTDSPSQTMSSLHISKNTSSINKSAESMSPLHISEKSNCDIVSQDSLVKNVSYINPESVQNESSSKNKNSSIKHLRKTLFILPESPHDVVKNDQEMTSKENIDCLANENKIIGNSQSAQKRKNKETPVNNKRRKTMYILPHEDKSNVKEISNTMSSLSLFSETASTSSSVNISSGAVEPRSVNTRRKTDVPSTKKSGIKKKSVSRKKIDFSEKTDCTTDKNITPDELLTSINDETKKQIKKPLRRKLYDPTQPIDSFNIDYDKEYHEKRMAALNVSKIVKKNNETNYASPICLVDKPKNLLNKCEEFVSMFENKNASTELHNKNDDIQIKSIICKTIKPISNNKKIKKASGNVKKQVAPFLNRRSTFEFQSFSTHKVKTKFISRKKYITCTRFHKDEVKIFQDTVNKLGEFQIEYDVTEKTTHLVVGGCARTINMLRAIARGCWILNKSWLDDSIQINKWLPEEEYELTEFSPAVQQCRLQRQAFGSLFSMDILFNCGSIFIGRNTKPEAKYLEELVILCKGKIVSTSRRANVIIGEYVSYENVLCVTEKWLLDSIMFNKKMKLKKYLIEIPKSPIV